MKNNVQPALGWKLEESRWPAGSAHTRPRAHGADVNADQYRHHLVLYDLDGYLPRLWLAAEDLASSDSERALGES